MRYGNRRSLLHELAGSLRNSSWIKDSLFLLFEAGATIFSPKNYCPHLMWSSESFSTSKKKQKTKPGQSSNSDLHCFNLGVINLTWWKDNNNDAKAGPSKVSQEDNTEAGPLRMLQKRRGSQSPQHASTNPPEGLHKQQRTRGSQRRNPFLDLYAAQDEEDEERSDTGAPVAGPSQASEVLPAGRVTSTSHVDDIWWHYEGSHTRGTGLHASPSSPCSYSPALLASSPEAYFCVYKLDVMTGMIPRTSPLSI